MLGEDEHWPVARECLLQALPPWSADGDVARARAAAVGFAEERGPLHIVRESIVVVWQSVGRLVGSRCAAIGAMDLDAARLRDEPARLVDIGILGSRRHQHGRAVAV